MELKIYWTDFAKKELKDIFDYYKKEANLSVARKLVIGITKETIKLQGQSEIGQKEELLENYSKEIRYLIFKNYKIIYWINSERNSIEILDVFDTRQNPINIKRNK
ncbi:Plasmid stabilization system protein ParE [Flavobacterium sp. CF108]|uniref:type II toxin-antitoxin system RelE/ParE family toxin n=1 Tax=unclassified Flavobacterium TaxID=196869 RepID=UPI0008B66377|nr:MULTISPECIES: type II toxin-antitoxin system RelE/ParE family toxin [unclassified Flavobacterium]SEN88232.1 Plasmid stabilization system protein ParE [Flavobacterium sp. fv08]SHH23371.1 Plasmid stabilization system protein ParE [Flavobacterium sp. CF108]